MKFRNIIILMLVSMIGLIAFQWYWIQNAIAVKREQFDRNVSDALQETVKNIEKQEVIYLAKQKINAQNRERLLTITKPNNLPRRVEKKTITVSTSNETTNTSVASESFPDNRHIYTSFPSDIFGNQPVFDISSRQIELVKEMLEEQDIFWEELSQNKQLLLLRQRTQKDIEQIINNQILHRNNPTTTIRIRPKSSSTHIVRIEDFPTDESIFYAPTEDSTVFISSYTHTEKVIPKQARQEVNKLTISDESNSRREKKAELVKKAFSDVLSDVFEGKRNIHERVNKQTIDTLLKKELNRRGITIPYHYGVKNNGNMLFTSYAVNYTPDILQKAYKAQLFPNDANPQNHFLYVYFPDNKAFIFRNLWSVFASSLLLVMLIGGIFYSSVNTMIQQKKLAEIKNDFINNMTHEFKTPISTISLAVEVLKDNDVKKDFLKTNRYLTIIQDESRRLGTQVEKVLQIASLDKGEVKLKLGKVNVHETIEQVLNNISVQIEQQNGIINLELDAENPEIEADEVHLTNIIYNLLDNANKYSPENPTITIRTEDVSNGLKIRISDNGIGMTKEQIERIFDRFYRVSTGNLHDVKGFGLGLSYVKKMIHLHNGTVSVKSKVGEGSEFEVFLPKLHS